MNNRLEGLAQGMPKEFEKLAEIFEHQVFELCTGIGKENQQDYLIPYMMNDAVEDYLILKNCRLVGEILSGDEIEMTAHIAEEPKGYVMVVRQNQENVFTLHFEGIEESINYYQYHRIGHFWVKGEEQWRQLVYIIGTIYDKYEYMGESSCNEKELELMRLIEFAPFRMWSPVHESLEERYPATYEGIEVMEELAAEADDSSWKRCLHLYRRIPIRRVEKFLGSLMLSPKREALYELICKKIKEASEMYPERDYGSELNREIQQKREQVHRKLLEKGFRGSYPEYERENIKIFVTEEHPFTIAEMEYENFVFRVQFMVSECGKHRKNGKNCGFFHGKGRRGWIISEIGELDTL